MENNHNGMLATIDMFAYMAKHADTQGRIKLPADDPTMLQAELDGFAHRESGYWQGHGDIQPGERRTVRHCYGEPKTTEIVG